MPRSKISSKILLSILTLLILIASFAVVWNTKRLRDEIDKRTQIYVSDVSSQMAETIDDRLARNIIDLDSICDSLFQIDGMSASEFHDFLLQKAKKYNFTSMIVLKADGSVYQTGDEIEDAMSLSGIQESFRGKNSVTVLGEFDVLYSVPIYKDGRIVGVLGGICDKDNMLSQTKEESFSGQGMTCVINSSDGGAVVAATMPEAFLKLDDLFAKEPDGMFAQNIRSMLERMKNGESGVFRFQAVDGSDLILSYNPLKSYSWVLLTLVPSDVISVTMDRYMQQFQLIIVGVVLLMIITLFLLLGNRKAHYEALKKAVFVDLVTGGMTNIAFQLQCRQVLQTAEPNSYCIVLLNIKKFKLINDHLGIRRGNAVLTDIMHILQAHVGQNGFVARANSDNFYLFLHEGSCEQISQIVHEMVADVEKQVGKAIGENGMLYRVLLQPGVYIVDDPELEITIMQDRANAASRERAEWEDGVCKFYDSAIMAKLKSEQELNSLFESSLNNWDFAVYLQPKVNTENGKICGAEALVRWIHPQRGNIYPSDFIPLFEANGKICELDLYVFEEVCRTMQRWKAEGKELIPISVNLSRRHFQNSDCMEKFFDITQRYDIPNELIELELTESIFFDDTSIENMKTQILEMRQMHFRCALDDFGSGYSSLGLLKEFDIDIIKLDRRFFLDLTNVKAKDIIAATIKLSHKIGATTVAEGIETAEQVQLLRDVGCDVIQGYIYSRPLPISEFEIWWKENLKTLEPHT